MSMQARITAGDTRLYNPTRDVAHNFAGVVELLITNYDDSGWAALREFTTQQGVTDADIAATLDAFVSAVMYAKEKLKRKLSIYDALTETGFFKQKLLAQVTIMALLGQIYTGMHYAGIREATIGNEGPIYDLDSLLAAASTLREKMSKQ